MRYAEFGHRSRCHGETVAHRGIRLFRFPPERSCVSCRSQEWSVTSEQSSGFAVHQALRVNDRQTLGDYSRAVVLESKAKLLRGAARPSSRHEALQFYPNQLRATWPSADIRQRSVA